MHKKYLRKFLLIWVLLAIPICGNWLFLFNTGELLPIEEIVDKQLSSNNNCIVGLATRNQGYYYKKEMYQRIKPEILVLGSSRVMEFRKDFFSRRMLNVGGSMGSINEGFSFVKDVFEEHIPETVILGLDYWWFSERADYPSQEIKPPLKLSHHISIRSYLLPYKWLWQKKITFSQYVNKVNPLHLLNKNYDMGIGVDGNLNKNGFASDGSYFYTKYITGREKSLDEKFQYYFQLIKQNDIRFENGSFVNDIHFQNLLNLLDFFKQNKVRVIVFIPPLAPSVVEQMKDFSLIADLRKRLKQADIAYYDYHDAQAIHANDCEFVDGTHGGDVLYARILADIAHHENLLKQYVNAEYLDTIMKNYRNIAMIPLSDITNEPEIDFLGMGCDKSSQYSLKRGDNELLAKAN